MSAEEKKQQEDEVENTSETKKEETEKAVSDSPEGKSETDASVSNENNEAEKPESESASEKEKSEEEKQVNEVALKEQKETLETLKEEVKSLKTEVDDLSDVKTLRKNIVDIKEKIEALFLISKSDRQELIDLIQEKFDAVKEISESLKDKIKEEYQKNLDEIKPQFEQLMEDVKASERFNDARNKLISFQNKLKEINIDKDEKDGFFSKIQEAFDAVNEKQDRERERYEMETSENYLSIKPKVLESVKFALETDNFNEARKKLIDRQKDLKKLTLKKDHLDELFGIIRNAFETVNKKQDEERDKFSEKAKENYDKIKPVVEEACKSARENDDFDQARQTLINAQKEIKPLTLTKDQRDELYGMIREVFNEVNEKQNENREEYIEECNQNFAELEVKVNEAAAYIDFTNNLNDIRDGLLAVQDEVKLVKLTRTQRNELFKRIRLAFSQFDEKRNNFIKMRKEEKKERLEEKIEEKKEKLKEVDDSESKIEEIEKTIEETKEKIDNLNEDLEKLDD